MKFNQVAPFTEEAGRMKEKANGSKPNMPIIPNLAYKLNLQHFAQATRSGEDEIMFGLADIIIGEGSDVIKFDGKNGDKDSYLQVEGGSVKFEPTLEDIKFADYGDNPYDQRVIGYEVTVTVVAGQETIDTLKLAIAGTQDVKDGETTTGVTDAPLGASNRRRAKSMRIHPRFAGKDHSRDINIYKVATNSDVERSFANEQGSFEMEFVAYARDNADANKPGNYFFTGAVDPNGVLPDYETLVGGTTGPSMGDLSGSGQSQPDTRTATSESTSTRTTTSESTSNA